MTELIGQCPCSGGGDGSGGISLLPSLAVIIGVFVLIKCIGSVRKQQGVSPVNKAMKIGIVVVLVVAVGIVLAVKAREAEPAGSHDNAAVQAPAATDSSRPLPRLVDLGAGRCIPCKMMAPILEELKSEYAGRLQVEFYDVWKNPDVGEQYGVDIIPTQIFYDASGQELWRHQGYLSKEDILAKWAELGVSLSANTME